MLDKSQDLWCKKSLVFSVKLAKSRSSKGWSVSRDSILPLIPKLPYETECDIIVGEIQAKARLNLEPRVFYKSSQKELIKYLDELIDEGRHERIEIEMLLNQENLNSIVSIDKFNELLAVVENLKNENKRLNSEILEYKKKNKLIAENLGELSNILNED